MSKKPRFPKAPGVSLPTATLLSLEEQYKTSTVLLVFYDRQGSDFWMQRLTTFEAKLALYRSQNVQVLGISVDDPIETAVWAKQINVTFPLLADKDGTVSKKFNLYDVNTNRSSKAVALVYDGQLVYTEEVTTTTIPQRVLPWIEQALQEST